MLFFLIWRLCSLGRLINLISLKYLSIMLFHVLGGWFKPYITSFSFRTLLSYLMLYTRRLFDIYFKGALSKSRFHIHMIDFLLFSAENEIINLININGQHKQTPHHNLCRIVDYTLSPPTLSCIFLLLF